MIDELKKYDFHKNNEKVKGMATAYKSEKYPALYIDFKDKENNYISCVNGVIKLRSSPDKFECSNESNIVYRWEREG